MCADSFSDFGLNGFIQRQDCVIKATYIVHLSSGIGVEITHSKKKDLVSKIENRLSRPGGHFPGC